MRRPRLPGLAPQETGLAVCILLLAGGIGAAYRDFATLANAEVVAMGFLSEAFMALGMTLVIITGGIDLSVGAVLPLAAILTASMLRAGAPIPAAALVALAVAAGVGLLNAALTVALRVHPFIVTLGTMLSLKGLNLVLTGGGPLGGLAPGFAWVGQGRALGVPVPLLLFGVLAATLAVLLRSHRFLQQVYLIGGNPKAARTSGVPVGRVLAVVYVVSAVLAAVAGVITASRYGSASAGYGQNAELRVITAVVIGGASLQGGTGSI